MHTGSENARGAAAVSKDSATNAQGVKSMSACKYVHLLAPCTLAWLVFATRGVRGPLP